MSNRLSQSPAGYARPPALPLVEMATAVRLQPRLRCGACHARLAIEPPALLPGQLVCRDCGRRYNEVVERIAPTVSFEDMEPARRGRSPRSSNPQTAHAARIARYRERKAAGLVQSPRWARDYDACITCGRTDSLHNAHGFCNRCKQATARQRAAS